MRALVIYESMFGNTKTIAQAIADGLAPHFDVTMADTAAAPSPVPDDVDLLVAGGPTHALGMSRPSTRKNAAEQVAATATPVATGLREWLAGLPGSSRAVAATFDTRVKVRGMPGSAARKAEKRLKRLGFAIAAPATTFWVKGTPGPLADGEESRARQWGEDLAARVARVRA